MSQSSPNILLILTDQHRGDALGCAGHPCVQTPHLDALAQGGTRLSRCYITQPTCTPSRTSLLTGCYPSAQHCRMVGCSAIDGPGFLPRLLQEAGYHTASIGKIHLQPQAQEAKYIAELQAKSAQLDYFGFQEIELVNGHGDRCFGPSYSQRVDKEKRQTATALVSCEADCYSFPLPAAVHSTEYIGDRTLEFLGRQAQSDQPFFLHCSFPDPHHPFTVPEPFASHYLPTDMPAPIPPADADAQVSEWYKNIRAGDNLATPHSAKSDRVTGHKPLPYDTFSQADWQQIAATYYGMISAIDVQIGRIMASLNEQGLSDNTIVIFTSDHGDLLGDHGLYGKGLAYESSLHVPCLLSGPGIKADQVLHGVASSLDLAPTILSLAGQPPISGMQGRNMAPALAGETPLPRSVVMVENDDDMAVMRYRCLIEDEWKYIHYLGETFGELYQRHTDPDEQNNLWFDPAHAETRSRLRDRLLDEVLCGQANDNPRTQPPAPPAWHWYTDTTATGARAQAHDPSGNPEPWRRPTEG